MRHFPAKRQDIAPPTGLVPLLLVAAAVLVALVLVMVVVV